jgi:hypothetical protein
MTAALPPYVGPGGAAVPPRKTLAWWAFGLSLVPCGIGLIVATVFAIVVLRSKGRHAGRGLAKAALAMVTLWVALLATGITVAVMTDADRDEAGTIVNEGEISVFDVQVGDCLELPAESEDIYSVTAVPCAQKHGAEAFARWKLKGEDFPGDKRVIRTADAGCSQRFATFVGRPLEKSRLEVMMVYPTRTSWNFQDDRSVICLITPPEGRQVTGTLRNARR